MLPSRRKVGLKRIDAALDALRPMGFPDPLVRRVIRNLLQAYGGDDGWPFIEESSYKLLIDTVLEEAEKSNKVNRETKPLENENVKDDGPEPGELVHSESPMKIIQNASKNGTPSKNLKRQVLFPKAHSAQGTSTGLVDTIASPSQGETSNSMFESQIPSSRGSSTALNPPPSHSSQPVNSCPPKRHRPCYGWISSDSEDESDLVCSTPCTQNISHPPDV